VETGKSNSEANVKKCTHASFDKVVVFPTRLCNQSDLRGTVSLPTSSMAISKE